MWFTREGIGKKMLRTVHLRSFSFYLAFWQPKERREEIDIFTKTFLEDMPAAVLLRASRNRETLICDGMNAWDSISESRNVQFEWGKLNIQEHLSQFGCSGALAEMLKFIFLPHRPIKETRAIEAPTARRANHCLPP